ncbi:hypothetical protein HELRODRAFT_181735 [Helobdella robusta]|uniref:Uncharacterized protein n=1 Tax=Helobdella robusta TaxID=6412 RepID=T1FH97_HELRO|nr:hypothetical protein HELRODRAFT_181735 [Helobdella robusta]ESN92118.1 hypothetical protein HELRODRAFT_181735 [Helobdella robusta]
MNLPGLKNESLGVTPAATSPSDVMIMTKKPKKIIHFSDGAFEEYSDDDDDGKNATAGVDQKNENTLIDPVTDDDVLDGAGEKLAWFFGITSPKYQYAIDEYMRRKKEEQEDREFEERERQAKMERETRIKNDKQRQSSNSIATIETNKSNISVISPTKPISNAEKLSIYSTGRTADDYIKTESEAISDFPEVIISSEIPNKGFNSGSAAAASSVAVNLAELGSDNDASSDVTKF